MSARPEDRPDDAIGSPERIEAVRRLAAAGYRDSEIGQRLGMKGSNVGWMRRKYGIPSGASRNGEAA